MKNLYVKQSLLIILFIAFHNAIYGQGSIVVSGKVVDESNTPLNGVTIRSINGENGATSDVEGLFIVTVKDGSSQLMFHLENYLDTIIAINEVRDLSIIMRGDMANRDGIVQLGLLSQKREEITGSVFTILGDELESTRHASMALNLQGRIPGLAVIQNSAAPSNEGISVYGRGAHSVRGASPAIIIDGIPSIYDSYEVYRYISPEEIESISYIKDAANAAIYGIQSNNGLLVITTKRGNYGKLTVNASVDQSIQQLSTHRSHINSWDFALLRNQAFYNDGQGEYSAFSQEEIDKFRSHDNPNYPNNNWFDKYYESHALRTRANVNISGGDDRLKYFANINFLNQGGQFETESNENYDPNPNVKLGSIRSNIDVKINDYLSASLRLSGSVKRDHQSGGGDWNSLYLKMFSLHPTEYGPLTPEIVDEDGNIIHPGNAIAIGPDYENNPFFGHLNYKGYSDATTVNILTSFGLNHDLRYVTPGLKIAGTFSYRTNSIGTLNNNREYERWFRTGSLDTLLFEKFGTQENTPLSRTKSSSFYYHLDYNANLSYNKKINKHRFAGFLYSFFQSLERRGGSGANAFPFNVSISGLQLKYDFDSRYFAQFDLGYSGSDQFAPDNRFFFNPAFSGAWVISNEEIFKNNLDWLTYFKLRASYGKTSTDNLGAARFAYLDNLTITSGPIGRYGRGIAENLTGNPLIEPEVSTKQNIGVDFTFFNAFGIGIDIFKERVENMYVNSTSLTPLYQGIPLGNYPFSNAGVFENKGYELSAHYYKKISQDFDLKVNGWLSHAKNQVVSQREAERGEDYAYRNRAEGYPVGQEFALLVDYSNGNGLINTTEELENAPEYTFGTPGLGDVLLLDLNDDGLINEKDQAPVGYGALPEYSYAMEFDVSYKAFSLSALFQGVSNFGSVAGPYGVDPQFWRGLYSEIHRNAWTEERYLSQQNITSPAIHAGPSVNFLQKNNYFYMDQSYIRLRNVELIYTLPKLLSRSIRAENIRISANATNLWTSHNLTTDEWDPEVGGNNGINSIPLYKTYSLSLRVTF